MAEKKYTLTEEHKAQLPAFVEKWLAIALDTKPISPDEKLELVDALKGMYKVAKLPPPKRVTFVPSVGVLAISAPIAGALWYLKNTPAAYEEEVFTDMDASKKKSKKEQTFGRESAMEAAKLISERALDILTKNDILEFVSDEARAQFIPNVLTAVEDAVGDFEGIRDGMTKEQINKLCQFFAKAIKMAYNMWDGGNQCAGWCCFISFFKDIVKLDIPEFKDYEFYEKAAMHGGPRVTTQDFCIISDRPDLIALDERRERPHSGDGPAYRWRDGLARYYWKNVRVKKFLITNPEEITIKMIDNEKNQEIKRIMIERFSSERYMREGGGKLVHSDDFGKLWRKDIPGDSEPLVMVEVVNGTKEPDGTFKTYFLNVHPELRPMQMVNGRPQLGQPQEMTAKNAVASTYGKRGETYHEVVRT